MSASAAGTANFLEKFDHLFDILNSSTTKTKNQYKKPYKGTENEETFLKSMLIDLKDMKVFKNTQTGKKDITESFPSITCFQITIKSVMNLWNDLKKEGLMQMKTRRLNQDCIENFFGKIRQQGGNSVNPTPIQFMNAFKKLSCMDLMNCVDTFNCAADVDVLLMSGVPEKPFPVEVEKIRQKKTTFKITNADFRRNDLPTRNVEQYISGYLLRKCLKKHSCKVCQDYAQSTDSLDSTKLFCHFKGDTDKYGSKKGTFGKLLMPEDSFVDYISLMEKILMENIKSVATGKTGEQLYAKLKEIPFVHSCEEFPYVYLLQLFIRMRIYYIAKYANRNFKREETSNRRVKKLRKLQILQHK